ncbi:short chain dehydrogenase [Phanerochaete sordida]|uniref:Short chain dehydrogenase n=1 Tax=Phanerochaete sordida TaxID=48140 RepID=A0A9P3GEA5_9APHY|nr:short chain dehydrogenase [Phanerochaete sordida]
MVRLTISGWLAEQWTRLPPPLYADLAGKTVVVTGANTGIGLEAAKHFARMNPARLILACRNERRGVEALNHIAGTTGYVAELQLVDLADFASVTAFAARLKDVPIDIFVANAAICETKVALTKDGWEQVLQVNYLSTALLSFLLLPNLVRAAKEHGSHSRLVLVTSELHHMTDIPASLRAAPRGILRTLSDPAYCTPARFALRYQETKIFVNMFARALAARLSSAVVPTAVNPGFCYTTLRKHLGLPTRALMAAIDVTVGRTAEQGARQLLHAALGPDGEDGEHVEFFRGAYVSANAVREPSDFVLSKAGREVQDAVWSETVDALGEVSLDVRRIVEEYLS